ncbi:MAG: 50S ribosomal protein L29 [Actinomycetota bacterium]
MMAKDLHDLSDEELEKKLNEAKEELFNLRFQLSTAQLDNPLKIRQVRKDIARIETIRRERELYGSEGRRERAR